MDQSTWGWTNQGGASVSQANNIVYFTIPSAVGENIRLRSVTAPATPWKRATKMVPNPMFQLDFQLAGMCLRESSTGKIMSVFLQAQASGGNNTFISMRKNTNPTTFSSAAASNSIPSAAPPIFFRVGDDGVNVSLEYSFDGFFYTSFVNELRGAFFTVGPDQFGISGLNLNSTVSLSVSYLSLD
jgi:hypothetical protein